MAAPPTDGSRAGAILPPPSDRCLPFGDRATKNGSSAEQWLIGLASSEERLEQGRQLGGVGDLLEPEDRALQVLEGLLVNLEAVGEGQDEARGSMPGQEPQEPLQARSLPEADDFQED